MNREEILRKSRKENKGADLYENDLLREGGNVAFAMITILCIVFSFIQEFLDIYIVKGFWALMFTLPASGYTVRALRTKDKWDMIRALAGWGAVVLWSVLYIRDMLAVSAIL